MWSPSYRSDPVYTKRSRRSSGRLWMTPPTRPMQSAGRSSARQAAALGYGRASSVPVLEFVGAFVGGSAATDESDRPLSWRNQLPQHVLGGAGFVPGGRQRTWLERSGIQTGWLNEDRSRAPRANRQ